jgi:anti-sigma-K factor RskA
VTTVNLSHDEIKELLGAYALDAVDAREADAVELHLRDCPKCRAEVETHREVAAMLAHTGAPAPTDIWDRIVASLDGADEAPAMRLTMTPVDEPHESEAPRSPGGNVAPFQRRRFDSANRWMLGAISAAAALVLVLGVSLYRQSDRLGDIEQGLRGITLEQVADDTQKDPSTRKLTLTSPDGDLTARMALHDNGHGFLEASGLPVLSPEQTYQLWVINTDGTAVSLGLFNGGDEAVTVQAGLKPKGFAITVEEAGGVIQSERMPSLSGMLD